MRANLNVMPVTGRRDRHGAWTQHRALLLRMDEEIKQEQKSKLR